MFSFSFLKEKKNHKINFHNVLKDTVDYTTTPYMHVCQIQSFVKIRWILSWLKWNNSTDYRTQVCVWSVRLDWDMTHRRLKKRFGARLQSQLSHLISSHSFSYRSRSTHTVLCVLRMLQHALFSDVTISTRESKPHIYTKSGAATQLQSSPGFYNVEYKQAAAHMLVHPGVNVWYSCCSSQRCFCH